MNDCNTPLTLVVVGANGYTGSALLRAASRQPDLFQVRAQVRTARALVKGSNIEHFSGSLEQVDPALFPNTPHILLHLAGKNQDADGSGYEQVNVAGTRALLAHCNTFTRAVLYHSSLSVLGQDPQRHVSNRQPPAPTTALARSRAAAEDLVLTHARQQAISAYCLRPRFILGKDDAFVMPGLLKLVRRGLFIGSGQQQFSIIDVDDYAKIILELCQHAMTLYAQGQPEQLALNVGYEQPLSFATLFETLQPERRAKRRIHYPAAVANACNWLPNSAPDAIAHWKPLRKLQALATQLQLIGLDHYSDVSETRKRIHSDLLSRDSADYFRTLATHFKESPCH
ncbi:MAG: NAD-dependent epimerase/dehydratase family protein [Pseudomonadota bacterium]|nr:NAD-dependent epimerase/dehydratase family protein [Pseudomonadota bacterium]